MTLAPHVHEGPVRFNKRELGAAVGEAGVLTHHADAESVEKWSAALLELAECGLDEISVEECDGLVDRLVEIISSRGCTKAELDEVGAAVAGLFTKFGEDAKYSILLDRMLDKVYMVPGGHVGLGALLGGIRVEDEADGRFAYFALDVIRVILRCLFLRGDVLQESKGEILGVCYDGILRVALRNGLENLADIMRGDIARKEFCGPGSEICRMAMLRISVYDKRDVPSDSEILAVLSKYPALSGALDPGRVLESKSRLTRLIHYISLNHLVSQEGHGWAYTAIAESSIRIRYWLDKIYRQHGIPDDPERDAPGEATQEPGLFSTNIMVSIRYLVLEIHDFWDLYDANRQIMEDLEIRDPKGVYKVIRGRGKTKRDVRNMRRKFGARPDWTFEEAATHINAMGLDRLVLYAHLVLMFQDAMYRAVPGRHRGDVARDGRRAQIHGGVEPVTESGREEIANLYNGVSVVIKNKSRGKFTALLESSLCMMLLYANFVESLGRRKKNALAAYPRFSNEVYNVKYMVLELANSIQQYEEMGLSMTKGGKALTPNFLKNKDAYQKFRNSYSAYARLDGIGGIQQLIEKNPGLISDALRDIVEVSELVAKMSGEFQDYKNSNVAPMTGIGVKMVRKKLDRIRSEANGHHNNEFAGSDHDQNAHGMKDEVGRILGLE